MTEVAIRPINQSDEEWISETIADRWGSEIVVVHQTVYTPSNLPGFIAVRRNKRVGLITYHILGDECEVVTLDSLVPWIGIGTSLIEAVQEVALDSGCRRIWLITTNDNLSALSFYQRRGFRLAAIYRNAVDETRRIKPEIPILGEGGIPIRDEIELEMALETSDEE